MSPKSIRRLLWVVAIVVVPMPLVGMASGRVPVAHQLELGLLAVAFGALESMGGITLVLAATLLVPALLYAAALWPLAWALARLLAPLPPLTRTRAALLLVMLGTGFALARPIYDTPFSSHAAHSTLLGVYR